MVAVRIAPYWRDRPLNEITRQDVREWIGTLRRTDLASSSVRRVFDVFASSLAAAADAELIVASPAYRARGLPPAGPSREVFYTHEQYEALSAEMPTEFDRELADFLVGTGGRWGEITGMHTRSLDYRTGMVAISEVWDSQQIKPYPKGRKRRHVPLVPWVADGLEVPSGGDCGIEHREGKCRSPLLFASAAGRPLDDRNWSRRVLQPALARAGLEDLGATIHGFRHTYASWLLQAGVPIAEVGRLLGHASLNTTMRYAHLAPPERPMIVQALVDPRGADVGQSGTAGGYGPLRAVGADR